MDLNRAGDSLYQGGEFFAEIQRGVRRTTAVGKRVDTYGFYPLNSRFPLFVSLAQTRERRPLRKGERQSGYHSVSFATCSQFTDSVLLCKRFSLRKRNMTVLRNSLTRCTTRHLRIRCLVQFIFAETVCSNALSNCAAPSCRACWK